MNENLRELIDDLLVKKAMYGLSAKEEKDLAKLQREGGVDDESLSFELTAASVATGSLDKTEQMPASLRDRILADAGTHVVTKREVATRQPEPRASIFGWLGWAFAALALAALAFNFYFTRTPTRDIAGASPTPTPSPEKKLTPGDMRQALMASAKDLVNGTWQVADIPEVQPTGDVVWSDSAQKGFVRLTGLPKNDPTKKQYQLWIVAENQDPKTPVDGGVFDITTDGEVIIPIDAKVKVLNPQAFAITVEKPGGVVVSKEKHVALAKRET